MPSESDLINKYRPQTFDEVLGQKVVIHSLKDVLKNNTQKRFLFVGGSGQGKTTIARILMKQLGCLDSTIKEVDGATYSGVGDMKALTETMDLSVIGGGSKGYIIDECDSLSKQAWQSLKKSIEEPPPDVYWVFCTTDARKVEGQINTRCAVYELEPVPIQEIFDLLKKVAKAENFNSNEDILYMIAESCNGSPRQALSLLAQCGNLTDRNDAAKIIGAVTSEGEKEIIDLCRNLMDGKMTWKSAMDILAKIKDARAESIKQVVIAYISKVLMTQTDGFKIAKFCSILQAFSRPSDPTAKLYPIQLAIAEILFEG